MIEYIKKNKSRLIIASIWLIVMVAAFAIFYIFKAQNEFFVSSKTKLIVVICTLASTVLFLFRPKIPSWLSAILSIAFMIGSSVFLFNYYEPLVNSMTDFIPDARIINIIIILSVILFFFGLSGNAGVGIGIGGFIVYAIYLADFFTISFRGTPFILSDILSTKTAFGVASGYRFVLNERMIVCFYILAAFASAGAFVSIRTKKLVSRIVVSACGIVSSVTIILLLLFTEVITKGKYETLPFIPIAGAQENGLPLNIVCSLKESFVKAPEGYSEAAVSNIIKASGSANSSAATDTELVKPNIIVIMNESLTDFDYLLNVELSEEPLPKFKALSENCVKGTLISSIFGGNTPNSEFEFLTGCSLAFLPQGIVAFQQLIDSELPTFVTHLENLGYKSSAIHLYNPEFFSRSRIYPLLGFDEFINIYNAPIPVEKFYDYAYDESSFQAIEHVYENHGDDPMFCFCVTIQNHGGYWHGLKDVLVTNATSDYANDYASLLKQTDDAFANLLDYFSKVDEPTIIVMFGDHQPNLFDDFYESIWDGYDLSEEDMTYLKAKVPFVIWANYDIEEETLSDMSINYLGPEILKVAGLPMSDYQSYLLNLHDSVPVISGIGFVDSEGNHFTDPSTSAYSELIRDYSYLQYKYLKKKPSESFYTK